MTTLIDSVLLVEVEADAVIFPETIRSGVAPRRVDAGRAVAAGGVSP